MRIVFALPGSGDAPVGGFKVVYHYANGLAERGHDVTVLHPARLLKNASKPERARGMARYLRIKALGTHHPGHWFSMYPQVRLAWVPSLHPRYVPRADVAIATAWQTAEWVAGYPDDKGRKFYLIQGLETWSGPESRVLHTWSFPMRKIVIASWLKDVATRLGQESVYIPNGLDFAEFGIDTPPENRNPRSLLMLYHHAPWKGSVFGLRAAARLREEFPDLAFHVFGVPARPSELPEWVVYHERPSRPALRALYNECAVFLSPSLSEGWALPPAEAMSSGAALVATDIGGHADYAMHEHTALLSPPENPEHLAASVRRLFLNPEERARLAREGAAFVSRFTWPVAIERLERALGVRS